MEIRLRNLHVVAKNRIEANLQRRDAGAFALALFHGRDNLLAVLAEVAKLVELAVIAAANDAGIVGESRRLVGNGAFEALANVGEFVDLAMQMAEQRAAADRRRRQEILQHRKLYQRFAQRNKFARRCQPESNAAREPFEVLNAAELFANFAAHHGLLHEMRNGLEARFDRRRDR